MLFKLYLAGAIHKFVEIMCRSKWTFDDALEDGDGETTEAFYKEDRWGSCECTPTSMSHLALT